MALPEDSNEPTASPEPTSHRRRDLRLVTTGVLLALGVWFAVANTQAVTIRFWLVSTRTPLVSALAIAAVFGAGIGILATRRFRRRGE